MARPWIAQPDYTTCTVCNGRGGYKVRSSGGNKYHKTCGNCGGAGRFLVGESMHEATDEEWLEQLEARIEYLESKIGGLNDTH